MTEVFSNWIGGAGATFHTGSGTQTINNFYGAGPDNRRSRSQPLAPDILDRLRRRFVYPPGMQEARQILQETHTVLIAGRPGSGRNAAARMLLAEYRDLRDNLHEVLPEDEQGNAGLERRDAPEPEGLLLDLSEADAQTWPAVHDGLPGFHAAVRKNGSRLAVVLPNCADGDLHSDLAQLRAPIVRPEALLVLRGALREAELPVDLEPPAELFHFLEYEPPLDQVANLAWRIRTVAATARSDTFTDWCRTAVEAFTRSPEDVARQVLALRDGRPKALLLTTAMLHGARTDAVHEACESLLSTVAHPKDDRPLLEREDLSARFDEIKATPDQQGRVTFTSMDYDVAIRVHFWNNMPGLRTRLGQWVGRAVTLESLTTDDRALLAERFAEQILRTGRAEDLLGLVREWIERHGSRAWSAASQALTYGALHGDHGRRFRKELYDWATSSKLSDGRAAVLVRVCSHGGDFASRYPEQALVRFHHVVRRQSQDREAEAKLAQLVLTSQRLHRRMLDRLALGLWLERPWKADIRLFAVLAAPGRLTSRRTGLRSLLDEPGVRRQLSDCWAALFARVASKDWQEPCSLWLLAAEDAVPQQRDQLLDILVRACREQPRRLGRLYQLAFRSPVAPLVQQKIDAAQGLHRTRP
ncbi:nSTAND3 domain-containing NTPase [Streptomyces bluensis]|uniref:Novel STAND NTPase 3 domain-containing protein n=1 Tax=Streptomyces bluensis TaxID=33897 RepID=A0ABW6UR52_9ACTN